MGGSPASPDAITILPYVASSPPKSALGSSLDHGPDSGTSACYRNCLEYTAGELLLVNRALNLYYLGYHLSEGIRRGLVKLSVESYPKVRHLVL